MVKKEVLQLTEEQIASNPAVDPGVVVEAERARKVLEDLGLWTKGGTKVNSPFGGKIDPKFHG